VGQDGVDFGFGHFGGVPNIMEEDESLDPVAVALLGPAAVVAGTQGFTKAV
jgi:hypothetical protein